MTKTEQLTRALERAYNGERVSLAPLYGATGPWRKGDKVRQSIRSEVVAHWREMGHELSLSVWWCQFTMTPYAFVPTLPWERKSGIQTEYRRTKGRTRTRQIPIPEHLRRRDRFGAIDVHNTGD